MYFDIQSKPENSELGRRLYNQIITFHFDLKQTRKNKNPGKNFYVLNNTHYNDINRYKFCGFQGRVDNLIISRNAVKCEYFKFLHFYTKIVFRFLSVVKCSYIIVHIFTFVFVCTVECMGFDFS